MAGLKLALIDCEDARPWDYRALWARVLGSEATGDTWRVYKAFADELPTAEDLAELDGVFISGSHYSVLQVDELAWIKRLAQFIGQFAEAKAHGAPEARPKAKLIGGCFGHQIIAHAIGGRVDRNPSKQFVLRIEEIQGTAALRAQAWAASLMGPAAAVDSGKSGDDEPATTAVLNQIECHEDCVHMVPEAATVLATSSTAPVEMFMIDGVLLGFQCHPEFTLSEAFDVVYRKVASRISNSEDEMRAELSRATTTAGLATAIRAFIEQN